MTEEDVQRLLDTPDKVIIQPMQWIRESGGHRPPWMLFESGIKIGNEIIEGLLFRARYRSSKTIKKGAAYIETGENFNVALFGNTTHENMGRCRHIFCSYLFSAAYWRSCGVSYMKVNIFHVAHTIITKTHNKLNSGYPPHL